MTKISFDSGFRLDTIEERSSGTDRTHSDSSIIEAEEELRRAVEEKEETEINVRDLMSEMESLLKKEASGTATVRDKEVKREKLRELSRMKKEYEKTTRRVSTREKKMLDVKTRVKEHEVMVAMKKKAIRSVVREVCAAECVDLAFIIDGTGSMASHIAAVQNSTSTIVKKVSDTNPNLELRLACVCYRDLCDDKRFEVLDFVSSVDRFSLFVGNLIADGGGDEPEDIAGGLEQANGLSWEHPTRIAFLIADAPCHGSEYHSFADDYPSGTPGIDVIEQLRRLTGNSPEAGSMSVYFSKITWATDSMLSQFHKKGLKMEIVDLADTEKLTSSVTRSIRHSIFKTISVTGGSTRSLTTMTEPKEASILKPYRITKTKPSSSDWDPDDAVLVYVFRNKPVQSMDELQNPLSIGKVKKDYSTRSVDKSTMHLCRARNPFAEGQIRIAFHGQLARNKKDLGKAKQGLILKTFKRTGGGTNDREKYLHQMEISNIVFFLALAYNKSRYRPAHCAKIRCLECCVVEEVLEVNEKSGNRRFCAEEPLPIPPGAEFVKYSNNTGYWNDDELDESLLRFAEYSYLITDGYLMATDLQGIKVDNQYYLTDPVILCQDYGRFGSTNLGPVFIKKCLDSTQKLMAENGWK